MANPSNYDYEKIERPYDQYLRRSEDALDVNIGGGDLREQIEDEEKNKTEIIQITSPAQITPTVFENQTFRNMYFDTWIKSRNYKPRIVGVGIQAGDGSIDCQKLWVAGTEVTGGAGGQTLFDAIVDAAGGGDYTDIQSAIDAGKKTIFVRKGTYTLTANITLESGISLIGEDREETIITSSGSTYTLNAVGSAPYTTGTATAYQGSNYVGGAGTAWSTNLAVNDFLILENSVYKILRIHSDTALYIEVPYRKNNDSGLFYSAGTFKSDIHIENFTIQRGNINFQYVVRSSIKNINVGVNTVYNSLFDLVTCVTLNTCYNCIISDVKVNNGETGSGIKLLNANNNIIKSINASNNTYGILIQTSNNNALIDIESHNNKSYGVYLSGAINSFLTNINASDNHIVGIYLGAATDNQFINIQTKNHTDAASAGIYLTSDSDRNIFSNVETSNNTHGIAIVGVWTVDEFRSGDDNVFSNIKSYSNTYKGFHIDRAKNNIITNCLIALNGWHGVYLDTSDHNIISDNIIKNNSQTTTNTYSEIILSDTSTYNIVSSNRIRCVESNKAKYGIREAAAADNYNLIHGNIVQGAVTANISLQGANSVNADNIS